MKLDGGQNRLGVALRATSSQHGADQVGNVRRVCHVRGSPIFPLLIRFGTRDGLLDGFGDDVSHTVPILCFFCAHPDALVKVKGPFTLWRLIAAVMRHLADVNEQRFFVC